MTSEEVTLFIIVFMVNMMDVNKAVVEEKKRVFLVV